MSVVEKKCKTLPRRDNHDINFTNHRNLSFSTSFNTVIFSIEAENELNLCVLKTLNLI